jgi:hypothetical protein
MQLRLASLAIASLTALGLVACKRTTHNSAVKDADEQVTDDLDTTCGEPRPLGTYASNPAYAGHYYFPADAGDIHKFCRPSSGECNASSAVYGRALCEDASSLQPPCPAGDGAQPVLCYPAISP